MHFKSILTTNVLLCSMILLTGCMSSTIQKEIEKTNKSQPLVINQEESITEQATLTDVQLELLNELDTKSVQEALYENDLDIRTELSIDVPNKKQSFTNPKELSQYISHLFFSFDTEDITVENYLENLVLYSSSNYLENLPHNKEDQLLTLLNIRNTLKEKLISPIDSYVITELELNERIEEAVFYRKYVLRSKDELYFVTILKKEGAEWKLFDDSPSSPYIATKFVPEEKKEMGELR